MHKDKFTRAGFEPATSALKFPIHKVWWLRDYFLNFNVAFEQSIFAQIFARIQSVILEHLCMCLHMYMNQQMEPGNDSFHRVSRYPEDYNKIFP